MSSKRFVVGVVALAGGLMAALQGCGGGGGGDKPTPAPTPAPGPPVWHWTKGNPKCMFDDPSGKSCVQVAEGNAMAQYLTDNYNLSKIGSDLKPGDPLGVYITMQDARPDASGKLVGYLHHYCKTTPCYKGRADCILSVALYNRHIMLDGDTVGAHLKTFAGRCAGYVLNTSKAENKYNKCAYLFDGASSNKLYYGCGNGAPGGDDCNSTGSAFYNICPSTGKECQPDDDEVRPRNDCTKITSGQYKRDWPVRTDDTPCYFTGPAFRYPDMSQAKEYNLITEMVKARIADENPKPGDCSNYLDQCPGYPPEGAGGYCCRAWDHGVHYSCKLMSTNCNRMMKWNEIVMDLRPMIDDLQHDPNGVIVAFVYGPSCRPQAEALRAAFKETYGGPGDAPLIYLDQAVNVIPTLKLYSTPFVYKPDPTREEVGALTWEEADEYERWMMTGRDEPSVSV